MEDVGVLRELLVYSVTKVQTFFGNAKNAFGILRTFFINNVEAVMTSTLLIMGEHALT
jgi:hypothetical protein